ncbi:MAG: hypothetical protein ACXADW_23765 [Candidatus Hodarchaeales archaeon]|jgi:hypothetical protein
MRKTCLWRDWRELVKYQNLLSNCDPKVAEILDVLNDLSIITSETGDRVGAFAMWIGDARKAGLITERERQLIMAEMIRGGM